MYRVATIAYHTQIDFNFSYDIGAREIVKLTFLEEMVRTEKDTDEKS